MANIPAETRDLSSPVWDMSQERAFLENLLGQRFNFFLIFFGFVINGLINSRNLAYLFWVLAVGSTVCIALALTLKRSQQKLDIILDQLFKDETHPATIVDKLCNASKSKSKRRLIGYFVPLMCCLSLMIAAILGALGILNTAK